MYPILELRRLSDLETQIVNAMLRSRQARSQADIMGLLEKSPSQATVSRAMAGLIEKGILRREGRTRGSRFALTREARLFALSPRARTAVEFDPLRISGYEPNQTSWLSASARDRMRQAAEGISGRLDASTYSRQIAERFLIDLSWASSRLEGNTYDFLDTEMLLKYGQEADGHDRQEAVMLLNHKRAIGRMLEGVGKGLPDADEAMRLHALMMNGLMDPFDVGRLRHGAVRISSSAYIPSEDVALIGSQLSTLLEKARTIDDPFEAGFFLLAGTSYLQAFGDGNKRMGRLLSNAALLGAGQPPLSFVEIDQQAYILGLIAFYETGETGLLAETLAESYELTAPGYQAAMASHRIPRQVELREGERIAAGIRDVVRSGLHDEAVASHLEKAFVDLDDATRAEVIEVIDERLAALAPAQAVIYSLEEAEVRSWLGEPPFEP